MLKLNTVKLGARMCPRSSVPLSDRKNPEYDQDSFIMLYMLLLKMGNMGGDEGEDLCVPEAALESSSPGAGLEVAWRQSSFMGSWESRDSSRTLDALEDLE